MGGGVPFFGGRLTRTWATALGRVRATELAAKRSDRSDDMFTSCFNRLLQKMEAAHTDWVALESVPENFYTFAQHTTEPSAVAAVAAATDQRTWKCALCMDGADEEC